MKHSEEQLAIFDWVTNDTGNLIIDAKAGSGKSSTILQASTKMTGSIIFLAFNKKISEELGYKLSTMGMPNTKASTIHKEGLSIYTKSKGKVKIDSSKVFWIADKFCQTEALIASKNFIVKLVSFAKQDAFGVKGQTSIDDTQAWVDIIAHHDINLDADIDFYDVIEVAKEVLKDSNRDLKTLDFDDMQYLPLLYDISYSKYDWVLVDEAQDLNVCRKLITAKILAPNGRMIAVGDKNQAIYNFCGAQANSMDLIKDMFNAKELPLTTCYRCGKNIIKEAQKYCPDIRAYDANPDGVISSMKYQDFIDKALTLKLDKTWGVVCRNNAPNVALAFALIRQGIGVRIEGKDIGNQLLTLIRKWRKVKTLEEFTTKITAFFEKEFEKANYAKLQLLEDKLETLVILIERCLSLDQHDLSSLEKLVTSMFTDSDGNNTPNVVTLSSIHKSKGLEWTNLLILGMDQFSPSRYATTPHAIQEETNLLYVQVTRAIETLTYITDCPQRRSKTEE